MLPFKSQKCRLTSAYGWRVHPITRRYEFHGGIDIVSVGGDEVVAVRGGRVIRSRMVLKENDTGNTWQWGNYIAIQGDDGNIIYYCHLAERYAVAGETVRAGDVIGMQGDTGQATGKHLHFEVRKGSNQLNAAEYLKIDNKAGVYQSNSEPNPAEDGYKVGDKYTIKKEDVYSNGKPVPTRLVGNVYTIMQVKENRVLLGEITSWVKI